MWAYPKSEREPALADWDRTERHEQNRRLLDDARLGDVDASWKLILNHQPLIDSEVAKVLDDSRLRHDRAERAEAWGHEVMVLARSAFGQFSGDYPQFSHWLRSIARNHALREARKEQRIQQGTTLIDDEQEPVVVIVPGTDAVVEERLEQIEREEMRSALAECLHQLKRTNPDLHELIWLQYKQGVGQKRIQTILADKGDFISVGAVGKRMDKARRQLGVCIRGRLRHG